LEAFVLSIRVLARSLVAECTAKKHQALGLSVDAQGAGIIPPPQATSDGSSEIAFGRSCPHKADVDEDQGVIDHQIGRLNRLQR